MQGAKPAVRTLGVADAGDVRRRCRDEDGAEMRWLVADWVAERVRLASREIQECEEQHPW